MSISAGSGQWTLGLDRLEKATLLEKLRTATKAGSGFPDPVALAESAAMRVVDVPRLPGAADQMTDGLVILCAWHDDQRVRGTRIFRAIARTIIHADGVAATEAALTALTARLAAPPALMRRLGLDETIRQQPWATEGILIWWWETGNTDAPRRISKNTSGA